MDNNYLMILNIKTFDDFMKLAIERGWVNKLPKTTTTILPEINVYQFNCFNKNLEKGVCVWLTSQKDSSFSVSNKN